MNARTAVHIDADIGEGFGIWGRTDDGPLLDVVSAANIACGFHAGDPDILRQTTTAAAARGVSVGAQVSYHDLAGFGRRFIDVDPASLVNDIVYQIGALQAFAAVAGVEVSYVKAHGALYNVAADHVGHASALVEAIRLVDSGLPILCQYDTELWRRAGDAGLRTVPELFVDRNYTSSARLVDRRQPSALITDADAAGERALRMVQTGEVESVDGDVVRVLPATYDSVALCVHSDTAGALEMATRTRTALTRSGYETTPIGRPT